MNIKRIVCAAAIALAAWSPAFSMAVTDLAGITGNGRIVEQERSVRPFSKVIATGSEEVRIHRGAEFRVVVACDENLLERYRTRVSGDRLELGFESGTNVRGFTKVTVDVWMPDLEGITLSGSGTVRAEDSFSPKRLEIVLSGSGSIHGTFEGGSADAVISGSGAIRVAGSAERLNVTISGSGDFDARDYDVRDARASIAGSGSVGLGRCDTLAVSVSGSGNVSYAGTPQIDVNITGSGEVRRR